MVLTASKLGTNACIRISDIEVAFQLRGKTAMGSLPGLLRVLRTSVQYLAVIVSGLLVATIAQRLYWPAASGRIERTGPDCIDASKARSLLQAAGDELPVVDARDRVRFARGHIADAINIPEDEMPSRLVHEVPGDRPVLVYCGSKYEGYGVKGPFTCEAAFRRFANVGYERYVCNATPIDSLRLAGLAIVAAHP